MTLIQNISQSIKVPAGVIQFAKDGKYEEAWILSLKDDKPTMQEIKQYIELDDYEKLIVEYIWNQDVDEKRYVLTVIQDEGCQEQNRAQFITKCLNIFYEQVSFTKVLTRIDQEIIGHEFLLKQPVQRVRLGVFNHWFSVGPIEMWDSGDEFDEKSVTTKIKARPEVERSKLNYQGLAFIYNFDGSLPGPYHVLKTPTCHQDGDEWVVDIPLIYKNMRQLLEE
ncbi:MAG: hypothetical protein U9O78_00550 [Patescibacteria group bacterium]|nr:hypothetical protein [Patescibacteria group bacterium]